MHPIINKLLGTKFNPKPGAALNVYAYRALMNDFSRITTYADDSAIKATNISLTPPGVVPFNLKLYRTANREALSPVLVYFHGGNWISGNTQNYESICTMLAETSGYAVMAVDYALAPEWNFPVPLYQGLAVLDWINEHGLNFGIDAGRIVVGGDNSGGNIAAALIHLAHRERRLKLFGQLLVCPALHCKFDTCSYNRYGRGYFISKDLMQRSWRMYLGDVTDACNELASPLLINEVDHVPQTLLFTAEYDPLRDEAESYAKCLQKQDVKVFVKTFKCVTHHFWRMDAILDTARQAHHEAACWLVNLTV
jgi:acetyl esterase